MTYSTFMRAAALLLGFVCTSGHANKLSPGLAGRTIVGYQGWYGCPSDFEENRLWQHWFVKDVKPQYLTVDLLPDTSKLDNRDLCDTGLVRSDGKGTVKLFSSLNPAVVRSHFQAVRRYGIDGIALQRFVVGLDDPQKLRRMDQVLRNVLAAAEASEQVFYITYDVSGAAPATVIAQVLADWKHLQEAFVLAKSPAYLKDGGRPVLQLWGFGFLDRPGEPDEVLKLLDQLKAAGVFLIGGVPTHWRSLTGDSRTAPAWGKVYRSYDAISPWTVGRFADAAGADAFTRDLVMPDMAEAHKYGMRYMPVVFPGFSWFNLMNNRGQSAVVNQIPRHCGRFMWRQMANLLNAKADTIYVAMLDEFDEGTAILPAEMSAARTPEGARTLADTDDACNAPPDQYLRLTGKAAALLHGRRPVSPDPDEIP